MKLANVLALLSIFGSATAFSLSMSASDTSSSAVGRRDFVRAATAAVVATTTMAENGLIAQADDDLYADFITTESGMKYKVTKEGDGAIPSPGQTVKAHYTGWLDGFDSIKKFDSSRDRGRPFSFKVGAGQGT